jgi:hypothetical protein
MRPCPDLDGLGVPCREFRPDLDIMFIGVFNSRGFFSQPEFFYGGILRQLKHIALDVVLTTTARRLATVLQYLGSLEIVSVVFGQPGHLHDFGKPLPPSYQVRRCRLRPLTVEECESTFIPARPRPRGQQAVQAYLPDLRKELEHMTQQLLPTLDERSTIGVWDYEKQRLKTQLKLDTQAFEEYCDGEWRVPQRQQMRVMM